MKILAVDTSTEACSAALLIDGEIQQRFQLAPRQHTKLILPMVQSLLSEADLSIKQLDAIAFGRGPGSFTGVRIATGVAQGLAYGADLPVVPISTLASIAQAVFNDHQASKVLAAIDARMGGVYWGVYELNDDNLMTLSGEEQVIAPAEVPVPDTSAWVAAGSGWSSYQDVLRHRLKTQCQQQFDDYLPQSASIVQLAEPVFRQGDAVEPALAMPVYLRNNVAKKAGEQKKNQ